MKPDGFVIMPAAVLTKLPEIGVNGLAVYAVLAWHRNRKTGECFPSRGTIATETKLSKATVDRAIAKLKESNLIEVIRRGCMDSNAYTLASESWVWLFFRSCFSEKSREC